MESTVTKGYRLTGPDRRRKGRYCAGVSTFPVGLKNWMVCAPEVPSLWLPPAED